MSSIRIAVVVLAVSALILSCERRAHARDAGAATHKAKTTPAPDMRATLATAAAAKQMAPVASPAEADRRFRAWVKTFAKARALAIQQWGPARLGKADVRIAELRARTANEDNKGISSDIDVVKVLFLVEASPTERAVLRHQPNWQKPPVFSRRGRLRWKKWKKRRDGSGSGEGAYMGTWLDLDKYTPGGYGTMGFTRHVGIREGRIVMVGRFESQPLFRSPSVDLDYDWDKLVDTERRPDPNREEDDYDKQISWRRAIVPVLAEAVRASIRLPPTFNAVAYGKRRWSGPKDASLTVAAFQAASQEIKLRVSVTDDVRVPLSDSDTSDKAFLAADHLEIWFKPKKSRRALQLGIAVTQSGAIVARWLHPKGWKKPVPAVAGTPSEIEISLPQSYLGRLTVAYSDSDLAGAGQQSLVATSNLKWGKPETFGHLVRLPGNARYPLADPDFAKRAAAEAKERALPGTSCEDVARRAHPLAAVRGVISRRRVRRARWRARWRCSRNRRRCRSKCNRRRWRCRREVRKKTKRKERKPGYQACQKLRDQCREACAEPASSSPAK